MFDAPAAIKDYLCKLHRLHDIPVFGAKDDTKLGELVKIFRNFYTGDIKHITTASKYSSDTSTTSNNIRPRNWLNISVGLKTQ